MDNKYVPMEEIDTCFCDADTYNAITKKHFEEFVSGKFEALSNLFALKQKQYGNKSPLADFSNGANMKYGVDSWENMFEVAKDYCMKHIAHVFGKGQTINEKGIEESLGDIAVYCVIMIYMVQRQRDKQVVHDQLRPYEPNKGGCKNER